MTGKLAILRDAGDLAQARPPGERRARRARQASAMKRSNGLQAPAAGPFGEAWQCFAGSALDEVVKGFDRRWAPEEIALSLGAFLARQEFEFAGRFNPLGENLQPEAAAEAEHG